MPKQVDAISHWHQLFENFQASSLEFYSSLETAIKARSVPELHSARIEHKEGGLASAKREYLRMHRGKHAFDICAAHEIKIPICARRGSHRMATRCIRRSPTNTARSPSYCWSMALTRIRRSKAPRTL